MFSIILNQMFMYYIKWWKMMISKVFVEILCKWISNVFFYFESISYVLYRSSDEKVRISKIILEFFFKSNSNVFYYFKSNSYVLYCISDEKKYDFKNHCWNFVQMDWIDFLCFIMFQRALDKFNNIPQLFAKKVGICFYHWKCWHG